MWFDVRLLRSFTTLARQLSFTAAATELGIGQPRLSALIRKLEGQVGLPLFERTTRRVMLTQAGAIFFHHAQRIELEIRNAGDALQSQVRESRALRIGSPHAARSVPARQALIRGFRKLFPSTMLSIENGLTPRLLDALHNAELDLVFVNWPHVTHDLDVLRFARYTPYLVIPPGSVLAGQEDIEIEFMAGCRIAVQPRRIGMNYFEEWYQPLVEVGAHLEEAEEASVPAVIQSGLSMNIPSVAHVPDGASFTLADLPEGATIRPIRGLKPVHLMLAKRKGDERAAISAFWSLAINQGAVKVY